MSNQESMFADQEQQPASGQQSSHAVNADYQTPGKRPLHSGEYREGYAGYNTDPREQQAAQPEEYLGSQRWNAGKIYPQAQPRRRGVRWGWIIVAVLIFLFMFGGAIAYGVSSAFNAVPHSFAPIVVQPARTFALTGDTRPTLDVNVNAASIHIHTVSSNASVTVETSTSADQPIDSTQQGNTINVIEQQKSGFHVNNSNVNVDITVPTGTDVDVHTGAGTVDITGVNGRVNVSTGAGEINVMQSTLSGQSSLHTGVGPVRFDGTLDPNGNYNMDTGVGSIDLTLPANAAFILNGDTDVSNDFGAATVGNGPPLDLHSGAGKVSIHKGSLSIGVVGKGL